MRQLILLACLLTVLSGTVAAQNTDRSHGYVFAAPGGTSFGGGGTLHVGGGGEGVFKNGVGLVAEVGYLFPFEERGSGLGVFSINGSYHFSKSGKTAPFVTGGYSGFFRGGYANGVNFGGGVNYWFKERTGLRFEFRDNVALGDGAALHFLNVRVGVIFR